MTLSIIIVNWDSREYVRQCLTSLFKHCPNADVEVIVVDGGSFDGCDKMLAREFPSVVFVQSEKNIGFARANNLGARHAKGSNLLFLNPDTEFLENSIDLLLQRLVMLPEAGAVGCRLLNSDRSLQTSCVQSYPTVINQVLDAEFLRRRFPRLRFWGIAALYSDAIEPSEVEAISGACILIKKKAFEVVGGFSENYFMYGEDLDLCFKLKRAGFRVYHVPETSIVHHGGGSTKTNTSNFASVMMRESVFRFMRSNRGALSANLYRAAMAVTSLVRLSLILPLLAIPKNRVIQHGKDSLRKWRAILRWSCGLESGGHPSS
jgi:GT2 family glycosyltransferase